MRNRQEWFNEKMAADIIARIYAILGLSCTCMNNKTTHKTMDINKKELYLSPEVKTFEVKTEGVICVSLTDPTDYQLEDDPFAF